LFDIRISQKQHKALDSAPSIVSLNEMQVRDRNLVRNFGLFLENVNSCTQLTAAAAVAGRTTMPLSD
jgi:hypothetical protein